MEIPPSPEPSQFLQGRAPMQSQCDCSIIEFHQGQHPTVVWDNANPIISEKREDYIWNMITVPAISQSSKVFPEPSAIFSNFGGFFTAGFYTSIPDVQARGFSRTICLALASQDESLISIISSTGVGFFKSVLCKMQDAAKKTFIPELTLHYQTLQSTIAACGNDHPELQSLSTELQKILVELSIDPPQSFVAPSQPELFSAINNDLRNIDALTGLASIVPSITEFLGSLPSTKISSKICLSSNYRESKPRIEFGGIFDGGIFSFSKFATKAFDHATSINKQRYRLLGLCESRIFHHCIFSILSGRTLAIEAEDISSATDIACEFTMFVPAFKPEQLRIFSTEVSANDCLSYAIVVSPKVKRGSQNQISILNLTLGFYEGVICPSTSIILSEFEVSRVKSESTLVLLCFERLKELEASFVCEMGRWLKNVPKSLNQTHQNMANSGLHEEDDQIYRFLVHSSINANEGRPILLNNPAAAGVGIVVYYE